MFLRVYELKDKFRYLFHEDKEKKGVIRRISSCIKEKFNGFHVALPSLSKGQKKDLSPINIIHIPVRSQEDVIRCFFTNDIKNAFRGTCSVGQDVKNASTLYECYYCSTFFIRKTDFDKHIRVCGKKPGVVYDFILQNVTFEDNIKYKGDLPFCVYADFETTAPTGDYLNPENNSVFAVSYALVFAWHPKLKLDRQMVVRGYNHSLKELADVTYLTSEQLAMRNLKTSEQLKDSVMKVHSKKHKNAIAEMFNIELKFACDILLQWFNYKFKAERIVLNNEISANYRRLNPVNDETKCCICDFPLDVTPKGNNFEGTEMSYLDFLIKREYSLIRNIYDEKDLKK